MGIFCPNKNSKQWKELEKLMPNSANLLWTLNNGNPLDMAPNGAESKLFSDLLQQYNGDRNAAIVAKADIISNPNYTMNGDEEPELSTVQSYVNKARVSQAISILPDVSRSIFRASELLSHLQANNSIPSEFKGLISSLNGLKDTEVQVIDGKEIYYQDGKIQVGRETLSMPKPVFARFLMHELVHAGTLQAYTKDSKFKESIDTVYNKYKKYGEQTQEYGLQSAEEFMSELVTNRQFRNTLDSIDEQGMSLLKKILRSIASLFTSKNTDLDKAVALIQNVISNTNEGFVSHAKYNKVVAQKLTEQNSTDVQSIRRVLAENASNIQGPTATAHTYKNMDTGELYQSVSDVKKRLKYGADSAEFSEATKKYGEKASELGTAVHGIMDVLVSGKPRGTEFSGHLEFVEPQVIPQLQEIASAINQYYQIINAETVVVDDAAKTAGTFDILGKGRRSGEIALLDYKTRIEVMDGETRRNFNEPGKGRYPDQLSYAFQTAMYDHILGNLGVKVAKRGIIPILLTVTNGKVTSARLSPNFGTDQLDLSGEDTFYAKMQDSKMITKSVIEDAFNGIVPPERVASTEEANLKQLSETVEDKLKSKVALLRSRGLGYIASQLESEIQKFDEYSRQQVVVSYMNAASDQIQSLMNQYKMLVRRGDEATQRTGESVDFITLTKLKQWKDTVSAFDMLEQSMAFLRGHRSLFIQGGVTSMEYDAMLKNASSTLQDKIYLEQLYKEKGKTLTTQFLRDHIRNVEGQYRLKAEKEYKRSHGLSGMKSLTKEQATEMNTYVNEYVASKQSDIDASTEQFIGQQMELAEEDTNYVYRWADTVYQSKNPIISGLISAYETVQIKKDHMYNNFYKDLIDLQEDLEKQTGLGGTFSDPGKTYDFMLEDDSTDGITLVDKVSAQYRDAYRRFRYERLSKVKDLQQQADMMQQWLDTNAPVVNDEARRIYRERVIRTFCEDIGVGQEVAEKILEMDSRGSLGVLSPSRLSKEYAITLTEGNRLLYQLEQGEMQFRMPIAKYQSAKFTALEKLRKSNPEDARIKFYDFVKNNLQYANDISPNRFKLNGRIPSISKLAIERFAEGQNLFGAAWNTIKRQWMITEDETMFGQKVLTDENGKPVDMVPIFFTNRMDIKNQSRDVATAMKEYMRSIYEYEATTNILPEMEYVKEAVEDMKVKTGANSVVGQIWNSLHPTNPVKQSSAVKSTSMLAEQLNSWFDMIVYGRSASEMKVNVFGKSVNIGKAVENLNHYVSLKTMGFNYISMVNNAAVAEVNQAIEAFGKQFISPASYTKASAEFAKEMINMMGDVGARTPKAKLNVIDEYFGVGEQWSRMNTRNNSRLGRIVATDSPLYWTTNVGEIEAKTRFLVASLMDTEAKDSTGKVIGNMYQMLSVKDGRLIIDPRVEETFDDDAQAAFTLKLQSRIMKMHGNYNDRAKVALQQNGFGKMFIAFRRWIIPTFKNRVQGKHFSNIEKDWVEGYYNTGLNFTGKKVKLFFHKMLGDLDAAAMAMAADELILTEAEKANVRRFAAEICALTAVFVVASLVSRWHDDEPDEDLKMLAANCNYQLYRLEQDMMFYWNPGSMFNIMQSPFAATGAIRNCKRLLSQLIDPMEEYTTGAHAGENKLWRYTYQMIPIMRNIYKYQEADEMLNLLKMF